MNSQSTSKRKAAEHSNPLLNPPKKSKREKGGASKRKLANAEEQPGGFLIVPTSSKPSSSQTSSRQPSKSEQHQHSQPKPTSSESRPDASSRNRTSQNNANKRSGLVAENTSVEDDVRAMDDESDQLRRRSVAPIPSPDSTNEAGPSSQGLYSNHIDAEVLLPVHDTPRIEKNRSMRGAAMARYHTQLQDTPSKDGGSSDDTREGRRKTRGDDASHRRRSSISDRGKRASSIAAAGSISRPHNSVSEGSFYKHIDCTVPESARARQLLVWCSTRSASVSNTPDPKPGSSKDPPLSSEGEQCLKSILEDSIKSLAERKIPIGTYSHDVVTGDTGKQRLKENPQNASNRHWQVVYSDYIDRAKAENDTWNAVEMTYSDYVKMLQTQRLDSSSSKAKGKQRAGPDSESWDELAPGRGTRSGSLIDVARSLISAGSESGDSFAARESRIRDRIRSLDHKLDQLYSLTSSALQMVSLADQDLDRRFATLNLVLDARNHPPPPLSAVGGANSLAGMHQRYMASSETWSAAPGDRPVDLLRALSKLHGDRPAARDRDAARRAIRDVRRVEESGAAVAGQRRLTGVSAPLTPRKMPGTPRRGSTPGRLER